MSLEIGQNALGEDILDEFLDQRVYEMSPGDVDIDNDLIDNLYSMQPQYGDGVGASGSMGDGEREQLSGLDNVREELSKLQFGNPNTNPCPDSVDIQDPSILDFSPETLSALPYKLSISNLPSYSRVETQIKLKFTLSPPPPQLLLHIPRDLISKNKFCLAGDIDDVSPALKNHLLYMDTYVLTSDLRNSCNICSRCIKREQKRASRRKTVFTGNESDMSGGTKESIKNNSASWANDQMMKKAIIFNCKEIVSFPTPNGLNIDSAKSLELSARIICYCRHHKETDGFKLLFVLRNSRGEIVAKELSSNIMIMDRKKTAKSRPQESPQNMSKEYKESSNSLHPLSPNSIDDSNSDQQTNTDSNTTYGRDLKRKKMSFDDSFTDPGNSVLSSVIGFSPLSNSDTNTSASMHQNNQQYIMQNPPNYVYSPLNEPQMPPQAKIPSIQRIIPAEGPIRGGIEVTLLGFNFRNGLSVKFGANQALATHCWSESTIVTYLPPASQPGQVLVCFEEHESDPLVVPHQQQVFTYTDDTDKQLIELALQIVGLKMNGKLEDAKNIARRIVGTDNSNGSNNQSGPSNMSAPHGSQNNMNVATELTERNIDWFDNAHRAVEQLTRSDLSTEEILINFLSLVDMPNCPIIIPNWQLANAQGQTLLHLATLKNYQQLIRFLVAHGCKIDIRDNQGITPLFLASMCGHRKLIQLFIDCKSNWNMKLSNDKVLKDYCDLNVLDMFSDIEKKESQMSGNVSQDESTDRKVTKCASLDSLNSMFAVGKARHVSNIGFNEESDKDNARGGSKGSKEQFARFSDSGYDSSDLADSEFDSSEVDDEESNFKSHENDNFGMSSKSHPKAKIERTLSNESTNNVSDSTIVPGNGESGSNGLWEKVKTVFSNIEEDNHLPSYEDLFPFGPSFNSKPKTSVERRLNEINSDGSKSHVNQDDTEMASDSSEDMVVSYINHPRKTVENDKMLLFFWLPALVLIIGVFFLVSVMGYRFESIETCKYYIRDFVGNLMVGNERLRKVFKYGNDASTNVLQAV
ncbi:Piso0_004356 [Millerozyma farinosa CBS 7064]|uniref:Piso0_004356 protein n=1 Tax=Pichia sorbitophila (strain ATCC MYA-4447 / BCRC 22081 / CBS 7064 / NBRC 10061 / NRRL Y-12695) TaxID=559304 RepID=G8Y8K5_PICSO|nr:Piso0_004356 [Millerozyma farinosa CBS 7064]CCE84800.1 Piso0_004356 [Millerozyma farinosa CBS 7064]